MIANVRDGPIPSVDRPAPFFQPPLYWPKQLRRMTEQANVTTLVT